MCEWTYLKSSGRATLYRRTRGLLRQTRRTNLASQSGGAKATASSLLKGYEEKHQIEFLNDGKYGNGHSWIPAQNTGWAQIELPKAITIDRVVLSRDRGGNLTRRVPVSFDILISVDGKKWKTVKKVRPLKAPAPAGKRNVSEQAHVSGQAKAPESAAVSKAENEDDFTPIFNGKNLEQWDHRKGAWEIADGAHLMHRDREDTELDHLAGRHSFRLCPPPGLQIRSRQLRRSSSQ